MPKAMNQHNAESDEYDREAQFPEHRPVNIALRLKQQYRSEGYAAERSPVRMGDQVCGARENNKECPPTMEEYVEAYHTGDIQNP